MNAFQVLMSRRWVLKSENKDLYYRMKDEIGKYKKFLNEKLGYQMIVNPYLVKIEKIPARPERWMGILDFTEPVEYSFFCIILMYLEDKEVEYQFVLSDLAEYVQSQYEKEQIDWTIFRYRRYLIRVIKYCVSMGIILVDDGNTDGFSRSYSAEVLYENTGASRYFMRIFTQDIMDFQSIEDFQNAEWIGVDSDRGIVRRQRVYRKLLMSMGLLNTEGNEEDFAYIKNYRNMIQGELEDLIPCDLQVYRSGAYVVLAEESRMGMVLPEENTFSDIFLLCGQIIREKVNEKIYFLQSDETINLSKEEFRSLISEIKVRFGKGFTKKYREMTTEEFYRIVSGKFRELELIKQSENDWILMPVFGKVIGVYPKGYNGGQDE